MSDSSSIKVALVTNMLPPYRVSFYSELAKWVDLTVVVDTLSEFNRSWAVDSDELDFDLRVLNSRSFVYTRVRNDLNYKEQRQFHFSDKLLGELKGLKPDVVVTIEFGLKSIWSILYGALGNVPVVLLSEGTPHTEGHVGLIKRLVRKTIVSQVTAYWTNGPESTKLLERYGADSNRCVEGMTGIETGQWKSEVEKYLPEREHIRKEMGVSGRVFLFSASLTPRKGVKELLEAAGILASKGRHFSLVLLGSGEEEHRIAKFQEAHPEIPVFAPGFVQRDELPKYFAAADWAVLPTLDDNWPLATLETLVAGLPQIFSSYNGATADLCIEGSTGYPCDPLNVDDFVSAWERALDHEAGRIDSKLVDRLTTYYCPEGQAQRALASIKAIVSQQWNPHG